MSAPSFWAQILANDCARNAANTDRPDLASDTYLAYARREDHFDDLDRLIQELVEARVWTRAPDGYLIWGGNTMTIDPTDYFDHDRFRWKLDNYPPCPYCECTQVRGELPGKEPHFSPIICIECERARVDVGSWLPWPKAPETQKRRRPARSSLPKRDEDFCAICTLTRAEVVMQGGTLEARHTLDRAALIEAGEPPDEPENVTEWICTLECKDFEMRQRRRATKFRARLDLERGYALPEADSVHE